MTKDMQNSHNSVQPLVVNTLCQGTKKHHNQKTGHQNWAHRLCTVNIELRSELLLSTETIITPGSEIVMNHTSL